MSRTQLPKSPKNPKKANNTNHPTLSTENHLFTFPWNWKTGAGEDAPKKKPGEEEAQKESSGTEESRKGVPSVVFAIHDADNGSRESPTPSTISDRKVKKQHNHHHHHHPHHHPQPHDQTHRRHHPRRPQQEVLPDDLQPIAPSPQVPIMVGNREDPIPCSDSLMGSVSRRYAVNGQLGEPTRKRPPNYRRTIKKQTIHDLTALESVSTYDLEQRYREEEVHNIFQSSKHASGKDLIALPKLDGNIDDSLSYTYGRDARGAPVQYVTGAPPARIGDQIVYNLSESSQKRQNKVRANISAHTASITESLEKMRSNLREKQSQLSHAVFDLKAKQKHQEASSFADRMRNAVSVNQRKPDTVPLLKNQNYISDIFNDIASKLTMKGDKQDGGGASSKNKPYIPKVSAILNSKREHDRESEAQVHRTRGRRGGVEVVPPGFLGPQPAYPLSNSDASQYRHPSRGKSSVQDDITSIEVNHDPCSITSPITEQLSNLLSPEPKSNSSLYLPNIRSRRSTPVADKTLPFRPSAVASPSTRGARSRFASSPATMERHQRRSKLSRYAELNNVDEPPDGNEQEVVGERYNHASTVNETPRQSEIVEGAAEASRLSYIPDPRVSRGAVFRSPLPSTQEIIDVTSAASSLRFKNVVDLTDMITRDLATANKGEAKDVIDVTSLASSLLSKTTVKDVICVEEDSQGMIRSKRKLAAMPKRRRRRGPPPTKSTGQRRIADNNDNLHYWSKNKYNYRKWDKPEYDAWQESRMEHTAKDEPKVVKVSLDSFENKPESPASETREQREEEEIVFAASPTANKGLFEGIWDMDLPQPPSHPSHEEPNEPKQKDPSPREKSPKEEAKKAPKNSLPDPLPKNSNPIVPPRTSIEKGSSRSQNVRPTPPPVNALELKGPLFMSPYSQPKDEATRRSSRKKSPERPRLQPPEGKFSPQKLRTPMEASATGRVSRTSTPLTRAMEASARGPGGGRTTTPLTHASSRLVATSSLKVRSASRMAGATSSQARSPSAASGIGTTSSPKAKNSASGVGTTSSGGGKGVANGLMSQLRNQSTGLTPPVPQVTPSSPQPARRIARGRDPSVLPWARRSAFPQLRRRDAPITVVNQREPEGTVSVAPIHSGEELLSDEQEESEETEAPALEKVPARQKVPPREKLLQIVRPTPIRRASALSKKGLSSERSTETRSVTFQEGDTFLGPKDEKIPHFICTDHQTVDTEISWKRNKSVRRKVHPWDKESQGSSRQAFHDLSTRDVGSKKDLERKRRSAEVLDKARARRHESRKTIRNGYVKRSMYDEVLDVTEGQQVIILDDEASQRYEVFPADSPNRYNRKKKLWDDVSELNTRSYQSHGKHWETMGDSSAQQRAVPRPNGDTISSPSKARSRRSTKREAERARRDQAMFFDFLCF